jgi:hypothetical protein
MRRLQRLLLTESLLKNVNMWLIFSRKSRRSLKFLGLPPSTNPIVKTIASRKLFIKRKMVEKSCQKYLDVIALKLSTFYVFKQKHTLGATFGDVLEAIKIEKDQKPRWQHIFEPYSYEQEDENGDWIQINEGDPRFPIPLPKLFTNDEWKKLEKIDKSTSISNHALPFTSKGKCLVVLPHSDFNDEMVLLLKTIGVKSTVFSSPDDLEVMDEDFLSFY